MSAHLPLGPVIVDVAGLALDDTDRRRLCHPLVGGIILFARNFESPAQLKALTAEIRALRTQELVICVDHEGGRVQRFREGFTRIPPMRSLVIGAELGAHGVDLSFTPVLDLDYGASSVIGDRAFHASPEVVGALGAAVVRGLFATGMGAVGKHFPGHGYATADSHVAIPVDGRSLEEIIALDVAPYRPSIAAGLAGIMPAHVVYEAVTPDPAGFSPFWLKEVLRKQLGFDGVIFSDDLSMEGASTAGGMKERALAAFAAGCDSVLVCNAPQAADELLAALSGLSFPAERLERIRHDARRAIALDAEAYRAALKDVAALA
ncbi:MAG: beta-N-acetylhexosaminidase [Proteobacteria bacterium]|nr:beta-N-acetylhexosaminidase [Pseudomonadota bacterium]